MYFFLLFVSFHVEEKCLGLEAGVIAFYIFRTIAINFFTFSTKLFFRKKIFYLSIHATLVARRGGLGSWTMLNHEKQNYHSMSVHKDSYDYTKKLKICSFFLSMDNKNKPADTSINNGSLLTSSLYHIFRF